MNYGEMTDEQLNRAVAERIQPDPVTIEPPYDRLVSWANLSWTVGNKRTHAHPLDFANDPAAWGWLVGRGYMSVDSEPVFTDHKITRWTWNATSSEGGFLAETEGHAKPGRAVAIAFLESGE